MVKKISKKYRIIQESYIWKRYVSLFGFILIYFLTSCSLLMTPNNQLAPSETMINDTQDVISRPTQAPVLFTPMAISTPIQVITDTPMVITTSSFRYIDPSLNYYLPKVIATQDTDVLVLSEVFSADKVYDQAIATVNFADKRDVLVYMNLDDLSNNGTQNSDIAIQRTQGSGGSFYTLFPINTAVFFLNPKDVEVSFETCITHFPITGMSDYEYGVHQGLSFIKGGVYCVITTEGRMAIIQFQKNSIVNNVDFTQDLSIIVTVYQKILN